jgi:hypothetical protein
MQCGHCGTQINEGFLTCPSCGAVYQKRVGCVPGLLQYLGVMFVLFGLILLYFNDNELEHRVQVGISCIVGGAAAFLFGWYLKKVTPYLWYG